MDDVVLMKFLKLIAILGLFAGISSAEESVVAAPVKIEEAEKLLAGEALLLDVRTKEEWDEGHLKDATLVTVTEDGFLENGLTL